ncbi:MAG: LPS assembly protein LptD [Candidatus Omnitrophica bacterium]|nr:LPS assembly protein LptD [Candidatus Omnitrophota bacterium]
MKFFKVLFLTVLLFCCVGSLFSQETRESSDSIVCNGDRVEFFEEEKKVVGEGNVVINYKDDKLTCDKIIIYTQTKDAICEGNVRFYQDNTVFSGDRLSYNFDTKKGTILRARAQSLPVYGKGQVVDKVQARKFIIKRGYITTCDYEKPHYRLQGKQIEILLEDKIVVRKALFFVGRYPLMYIPYYSYPLRDDRMRVTIIPGYSKAWGIFALTYWRYYFNDDSRGYIRLDYREKKDLASGIDYYFQHPALGKGEFNFYYMDERDLSSRMYHTPRVLVRERERFSIDLTDRKERKDRDEETTAILEYHKYNDPDFRKDYFYQKYETWKKEPESYFSYSNIKPYYSLNLYARKRINRFWTETDTLPELRFTLPSYRIADSKFYYEGVYSFANFNRKTAFATSDDVHDNRFDLFNKMTYTTNLPGWFNWLKFTPYTGIRQTLYSRNLDGSERNFIRGIPYYGWQFTTKFSRIFPVERDFLGIEINKLRHVITPSVSQEYIWKPTVPSYKLAGLGGADGTDFSNTITFSIDQRFQTKWLGGIEMFKAEDINIREHFISQREGVKSKDISEAKELGEAKDKKMEIVDLINWYTYINFYPHEYYLGPNANIKDFSTLNSRVEIRPKRWMQITADATYNKYTRDFETFNMEYTAKKKDKWQLDIGHRYQQNNLTEFTGRLYYILSPKWCIGIFERFDFKAFDRGFKKINDVKAQEYTIIRDLHCWTAELTYNVRRGYGGEIWLVFRLKANPEVPVEWSTSFNERKAGSQWYETK